MPDKKISELSVNAFPGIDSASVPIIETAVVNGVPVHTNFRATVRTLVAAGAPAIALDSLSDVATTSVQPNDLLSYVSGQWRNRAESDLLDGGNF